MKLIDKAAVMAEIERRISLFKKEKKTEKWSAGASQINVVSLGARIAMLEEILSFLNTLEVKEVDLEKEIKLIKGDYEQVDVAWNNDFDFIARHFFELGLKAAQKGE